MLLAASFSGPPFFLLAWVALIPYLTFLLGQPSFRFLLLGHLLFSVPYFGIVLYWIPRVLMVYGKFDVLTAGGLFALMLLVMSLYLLPVSLLGRWGAGRWGRAFLAAFPGLWLLTELARNYYLISGFPWALVGYSQAPYSALIQVADVGGVYLVSMVVVGGNAALLAFIRARTAAPLLLFLPFFLLVNLYGIYRLHLWSPSPSIAVRTALVQPNVELFQDQEHYAVKYFETLPQFYREASESGAGWVIFPEASNPYLFREDFYYTTFWQRLVSEQGSQLLFNATLLERGPPDRYYNSAVLLNPQGQEAYEYRKTHLVPFGEYIPAKSWLEPFFEPLIGEVSEFTPGDSLMTGAIDGGRFGTLICFEGIFPELSRELSRQGAQILVNLTNDAWYGRTAAPDQHLVMASFRAIENRKPFLRAANSGYSAFVDPWGRTEQSLGLFQEGMMLGIVVGNRHTSVYSLAGEWINIALSGALAVAVLLAGGAGPKTKKKKRRRPARK